MLSTVLPNTRNSWDWMTREMNRLFESARAMDLPSLAPVAGAWPGVNLWHDGDNIVAEAELPGFCADDIEITATEASLTIRGARASSLPEGATILKRERSMTRFERSLPMPVEIEPDGIQAQLSSGVLRVTMPVAESARPRRIQVQSVNGPHSLPRGASQGTSDATGTCAEPAATT